MWKYCHKNMGTSEYKNSNLFNLQFLSYLCMDYYATRRAEAPQKTFPMIYKYIFVGYIVSEIFRKIVYTNCPWYRGASIYDKIYPSPYIPLCRSYTAHSGY